MNIFKEIIEKFKNWRELRQIRKLPDIEILEAIEGGDISGANLVNAVENIESTKVQQEALEGVSEHADVSGKTIVNIADIMNTEAVAGAFLENPNLQEELINSGGTNLISEILKSSKTNEYEELYKMANNNIISDYDLTAIIEKIVENKEKEGESYNKDKILEVVSTRLQRNIEKYGGPMHYQIFMKVLKTEEEYGKLPETIANKCKKRIEELNNQKKPDGYLIDNLKRFNKVIMEEDITKYKESMENKGETEKEESKQVELEK